MSCDGFHWRSIRQMLLNGMDLKVTEQITKESDDPVVILARFIVNMVREDLDASDASLRNLEELGGLESTPDEEDLASRKKLDVDELISGLRDPLFAAVYLKSLHNAKKISLALNSLICSVIDTRFTMKGADTATDDRLAREFGHSVESVNTAENLTASWAAHAKSLSEKIQSIKEFERLCLPLGLTFTSDEFTTDMPAAVPAGIAEKKYH